jgi:hypothetical protein
LLNNYCPGQAAKDILLAEPAPVKLENRPDDRKKFVRGELKDYVN